MPTKKKSKSSKKSGPTLLLEKQHREVKAIFKKLEDGKGNPAALLKELSNNLAAHMAIEQEIYYPAVKKIDEDMIFESFEEHSLAEIGLKRLLATKKSDDAFDARVTAVKELIEHHVEEEEEDLFPKVDKKLDAELLEALRNKMTARFAEALAQGFAATVPKGESPKTSADVEALS